LLETQVAAAVPLGSYWHFSEGDQNLRGPSGALLVNAALVVHGGREVAAAQTGGVEHSNLELPAGLLRHFVARTQFAAVVAGPVAGRVAGLVVLALVAAFARGLSPAAAAGAAATG